MAVVTVLYGMDTLEVTVSDDGRVSTVFKTDTGPRTGPSYPTVDEFLDDQVERGYGRQCRMALHRAGLVEG